MTFGIHRTNYLVKSEDLNHHGTLYAGRSSEWFVGSGFICVAYNLEPSSIVCLRVHGIEFLSPVRAGHIVTYSAQIVRTGRTTIMVYVEARDYRSPEVLISRGFITFCHVDSSTHSEPHGLEFIPQNEREVELNNQANELNRQAKELNKKVI
ncbi:MAG: hotdog domain-containing protein [Mucinivorans sp.]